MNYQRSNWDSKDHAVMSTLMICHPLHFTSVINSSDIIPSDDTEKISMTGVFFARKPWKLSIKRRWHSSLASSPSRLIPTEDEGGLPQPVALSLPPGGGDCLQSPSHHHQSQEESPASPPVLQRFLVNIKQIRDWDCPFPFCLLRNQIKRGNERKIMAQS